MDGMTLPPELARLVAAAIPAGRFSDLVEVVAAGASLLQRREDEPAAFVGSPEEAEAESEHEGFSCDCTGGLCLSSQPKRPGPSACPGNRVIALAWMHERAYAQAERALLQPPWHVD